MIGTTGIDLSSWLSPPLEAKFRVEGGENFLKFCNYSLNQGRELVVLLSLLCNASSQVLAIKIEL